MSRTDGIKLGDVPRRAKGVKETLVMDPVHGLIDISQYPVLSEIIATPYFQRLRRLSQLGLGQTVYPGATHTRFSHCIGAMHVFLTLFDAVTRKSSLPRSHTEMMRPVGAVSMLLHDIGHGPFSHASERMLEGGRFDHEDMTHKIIKGSEISSILRRNNIDPETVYDVLTYGELGDMRFVSQLVSSELDSDRLDYQGFVLYGSQLWADRHTEDCSNAQDMGERQAGRFPEHPRRR